MLRLWLVVCPWISTGDTILALATRVGYGDQDTGDIAGGNSRLCQQTG
jgi:hypothetical protein